ncbi:MAG: hypothetical protein LJE66_01880 [Desulfobacterales bacterium]|jgi:hypothetical protein|nr:hypothetical protein [Desulfobacterales bacterium]
MQDLFPLLILALFVYLLFFRKGGMGMGCCDGHSGHGGHGREPHENRHFNAFPEGKKEDVIDLRKDQYTVLPVEEDQQPETIERTSISKTH